MVKDPAAVYRIYDQLEEQGLGDLAAMMKSQSQDRRAEEMTEQLGQELSGMSLEEAGARICLLKKQFALSDQVVVVVVLVVVLLLLSLWLALMVLSLVLLLLSCHTSDDALPPSKQQNGPILSGPCKHPFRPVPLRMSIRYDPFRSV